MSFTSDGVFNWLMKTVQIVKLIRIPDIYFQIPILFNLYNMASTAFILKMTGFENFI